MARKPQKGLTQGITLTETLTKIFGKLIIESIIATDTLSKKPSRPLSENITLTDSTIKSMNKVFLDNAVITESIVKKILKVIIQSIIEDDITSFNITGTDKFIKTRYITAKRGLSLQDRELMKLNLGEISLEDIEKMKKDVLGELTAKEIEILQKATSKLGGKII